MSNGECPVSPSHRTFTFDSVVIDSKFDSGNCCGAEKVSANNFNIWIGTDHPKNNYRTWFYFSITGFMKETPLSFTIKNMQNQSRLLNEGLVPVYKQEDSEKWKRVNEKVNLSAIQYCEGYIEWTFKHRPESNKKHYFALFYPWSNEDNHQFLNSIEEKARLLQNIYCYRGTIIKTIEGRPVDFMVISSKKYKQAKEEKLNDANLFIDSKKPHVFGVEKKGIVVSARVHPGQVPGSHVMTGIIKYLLEEGPVCEKLRDEFVFYIFPILNPDGVARGHYRVDTNGINLNRCYLNPSAKEQPSIYAVKKVIMHLHGENKFYAYLDLHAHAARKGTFIYGNCSNELLKQTKACLFPKILSLNSMDFEYEGSNFTAKNMYSKDRGDHISKEGSGRVAIFKQTKNPNCWTLQCNYNMSRVLNILDAKKCLESTDEREEMNENNLERNLIIEYRNPPQTKATQFFTVGTYQTLGRQICEAFLDLIERNPESRLDNPNSYFKSVKNLKLNLALSLLKMAPNRFEPSYKKIYYGITNSENQNVISNSLKALYFMVIRGASIPNTNDFVKNGDVSKISFPFEKALEKKSAPFQKARRRVTLKNFMSNRIENEEKDEAKKASDLNEDNSKEKVDEQKSSSGGEQETNQNQFEEACFPANNTLCSQKQQSIKRISIKIEQFRMIGINSIRKSGYKISETTKAMNMNARFAPSCEPKFVGRSSKQELPFLGHQKYREEYRRLQGLKKSQLGKGVVFIE